MLYTLCYSISMQIEEWLKINRIGQAEFADLLGCKHRNIVNRWFINEVLPNRTYQAKIKKITNGLVTPVDWGIRLNDSIGDK